MAESCPNYTLEYFDFNVLCFFYEWCYSRGEFKDHDGSLFIIDDEMPERKIIPVNIEDL